MKRKALLFALIIVALILVSFTTFMTKSARAADNYSVVKVNHTIEVMYNGYIFINDTVQINGTASDGFLIGFPYKYGLYVLRCIAYDAAGVLPVSLNVPLENRSGFYGVRIDLSQTAPQVFTVGFILSNNLISLESHNMSELDFPQYPSLTKDVIKCDGSIHLPEGSTYIGGTIEGLRYSRENLPSFSNLPASVTFSIAEGAMQIVDIKELKREIRISGTREIEGSDFYRVTSMDSLQEISSVGIVLPQSASGPSAYDQLGRGLDVVATENVNRYQVSFASPLEIDESAVFIVRYCLPAEGCIEPKGSRNFNLIFPLFQDLNYYIDQASVTFVLPEGARMLSFENASVAGFYSVTRDVFHEGLTISRQGVFWLDSFSVGITYEYDFLWLSFRPTLWMWALSTIGCAIAVAWRRPKAPVPVALPEAAVRVHSRDIKSFVDAYEKKRRMVFEIESLKTRVRRGKIPRRRYKVRTRTLETRLNTLSRSLTDSKEKLRAAGGRYGDLMRRLEIVETEISGVEANIESIETRHRRGELSLGAYRKLLADYERRKDKAETTIDEILIRLREEIR